MGKNCVLSGYFGFKNFGDEAILDVLVKKLQKDGHNITIISSNPGYTQKEFKNVNSVYTFDYKEIIKTIFKTDILISGGGSLLQDVTSSKSLLYYIGVIFLGLLFRKKVIIFAQGIGPINDIFSQYIVPQILKHCHYISVRDNESYEYLKKHKIKADLLCDPVFSTEIKQDIQKEKSVAIQLRNSRGISADFISRLAKEVSENFPDHKIEIFSFQDEIDFNVCKEFEKNLLLLNPDINTVVYKDLSNNAIINQMAKSQYLIAMRYHAIIVGLLTKIKTLAINYDIKVGKIAKEFDLPLVNFNSDMKEEFDRLINENIEDKFNQAKSKKFDWSGFENTINS